MRLFIAIPIAESVRAALAEFQSHLAAGLPGWRWSRPENLHLTLAFLGETNPDKIPRIEGILRRACAEAAPFELELSGLGAFPSARDPRVLYLGCARGEAELSALAGKILPGLRGADLLPEAEKDRAFRAHLTLARRPPGLVRTKAAADLKPLRMGPDFLVPVLFEADCVCLYESRPSSAGSEYRLIFRLGLDKRT